MGIGELWYDDSPARSLESKVLQAVGNYEKKYGQSPTLCLVNPLDLIGAEEKIGDVRLVPKKSVLPNYFWIGVDEEVEAGATA